MQRMIGTYLEYGYEPIPLPSGRKAQPPKGWTDTKFGPEDFPEGCNIGIHCRNFTILDADRKDIARRIYQELVGRGILTTIVETKKGAHFLFAGRFGNSQNAQTKIDTRGLHGYGVAPPSVVEDWTYRFVPGHELVTVDKLGPFPIEYAPKPKETITKEIDDVERYVMTIESRQGKAGSKGLVRAAARCRDAGYSESQTLLLLLRWNQGPTVDPPWTDKELARAITNVFKKGGK
ncbi:MAG: bifunctional DNA primase/polymerase [Pirellulaceae bacterium]